MYFLVNAYSAKPWDVATSNLLLHRSHNVKGTSQILCDLELLDVVVKVK